jgi:hypothetical protein
VITNAYKRQFSFKADQQPSNHQTSITGHMSFSSPVHVPRKKKEVVYIAKTTVHGTVDMFYHRNCTNENERHQNSPKSAMALHRRIQIELDVR